MKHRDDRPQHGAESQRTQAEHEYGPTKWCPKCNPVCYSEKHARHKDEILRVPD